jgi:hypothetical protein
MEKELVRVTESRKEDSRQSESSPCARENENHTGSWVLESSHQRTMKDPVEDREESVMQIGEAQKGLTFWTEPEIDY